MADPLAQYNEFTPQVQGLERQRKMAQILMQQGMQQPQGQMVSGHYVAPSWTQGLANLANVAAGVYGEKKADEKAMELARQLRGKQQEAVQEYFSALQPGAPTERVYASDVGPAIEMVQGKPDYQKALRAATGDFAPSWLTGMAVKQLEPVKLGEGEQLMQRNFATGELTPMAGGGVKLAGKVKEAAQLLGINKPIEEWTPQERNAIDAKVHQINRSSAPNMTAITNVQAFEPFANKVQSKMGEGLIENYQTLKNIPTQIKSLDEAARLAPKSFAGSQAENKLAITKFFNNNLGTNIAAEKVKNTEQLRAALFTNVMENLKKLDASPSQQQQQVLQQSMGSIGTDPNAIPDVVNVYKQILVDKAKQHNLAVQQSEQGPAKIQFPYSIYVPLETQGQTGWSVKGVK